MDRKLSGKASEMDWRMGDKLKSERVNLQAMAEKGAFSKPDK